MDFRTIDDIDEFVALEAEWDALLASSPSDTPFLRHGWVCAWWLAYGAKRRLHVVTCRDGETGDLLGVAPLYCKRRGRAKQVRVLRLLGDEKSGSSRLGAFARTDVEEQVIDGLCAHLFASTDEWDVLDLRMVDGASRFFSSVATPRPDASVRACRDRHPFLQIALPADWDTYLSETLTRHQRGEVRRCRRRTLDGGAHFEMIGLPEELPQAVDDFVRLWEGRMRVAVSPDFTVTDARRDFTARSMHRLLREDRLRLGFLEVGGRRVATEFQLRYGHRLYGLAAGFESEFAKLDVGRTIFGMMLERGIQEGCTAFDFGNGDQKYKMAWGVSSVERLSDVCVYLDNAAGRSKRRQDEAVEWATAQVLASPAGVRDPLLRLGKKARSALSD